MCWSTCARVAFPHAGGAEGSAWASVELNANFPCEASVSRIAPLNGFDTLAMRVVAPPDIAWPEVMSALPSASSYTCEPCCTIVITPGGPPLADSAVIAERN